MPLPHAVIVLPRAAAMPVIDRYMPHLPLPHEDTLITAFSWRR
jgi:hypothetical protein